MTLLLEPHVLVRFVDAGDWITEAIDLVTDSIWPHVEFGTSQSMTPDWIGAHHDGGVQERPFAYCKAKREKWYALPCTQEVADAFVADCRADIGLKYNDKDIEGLLLHLRHVTDAQKVICSQWAFKKLWGRGWHALNVAPGWEYLVTPETLHLSPIFLERCVYNYVKGAAYNPVISSTARGST